MTYEVETITGAEVAAARKRHKLTRPQFMELAGLDGRSTSRLSNIERLESWKSGDREKVVEALNRLDGVGSTTLDEAVTMLNDQPAPDAEEPATYLLCGTDDRDEYDDYPVLDDPDDHEGEYAWVAVDERPAPAPDWLIEQIQLGPTSSAPAPSDEVDTVVRLDSSGHDAQVTHYQRHPAFDVAPVSTSEPSGYLVSNSLLQAWKRCRRKWWLAWYRNLTLRAGGYVGVRATGDRIHRALAAYYVPAGEVRVNPRDALERAILEDWTAIDSLARENGAEEDLLGSLAAEFAKSTNLERAMVEGYVQWLEETGEDADLEVIASETTLTVDLETAAGRPVRAIGLLDVRTRNARTGTRRFLDHKSVQELTSPPITLQGDEQMLHYHLLEWLNTEEGEARCEGALYNMLRRVKRTAQAKPPFYDRIPIDHNLYELEAYRTQMLAAADDVLAAVDRLDRGEPHQQVAYPSRRPSCRFDCDFFAVCGLFDDGSRAEAMVSALYKEADPHDRYLTRDGVSL